MPRGLLRHSAGSVIVRVPPPITLRVRLPGGGGGAGEEALTVETSLPVEAFKRLIAALPGGLPAAAQRLFWLPAGESEESRKRLLESPYDEEEEGGHAGLGLAGDLRHCPSARSRGVS